MSSPFVTEQGIDRTVFLIFGAIMLIIFIVVSAAGMGQVERSAENAGSRNQPVTETDAEIGN